MFLEVSINLFEGMLVTFRIFLLTLLFSLPLGLIISFGSMSKFSSLKWLVKVFVWIIRGTPLMLQLLIVLYGPGLFFGLPYMSRFGATLLAFSINYACFFSEIYCNLPKG